VNFGKSIELLVCLAAVPRDTPHGVDERGRPHKPMSRDIPKTEQAILDELSAGHLAVTELAERLDASDRQIRRAVNALADRGLINLYKVTHQLPDGRYAPVKLFAEKPSHRQS
jgi:predicted ArsR family transcriptional regulator